MNSQGIGTDTAVCSRETGPGAVCGQPAVLWALVDGDGWEGSQVTACAEHRAELLDHPDTRVTSDALILYGDAP